VRRAKEKEKLGRLFPKILYGDFCRFAEKSFDS